MKNNEQLKNLLTQSLRLVPEDFALQGVKVYIRNALQLIQKVEEKRKKREIVQKESAIPDFSDPVKAKKTLEEIDKLIESESEKLKNKKINGENEDLQTIFD